MPLASSETTSFAPIGLRTGSDPVVTNTGIIASGQNLAANSVMGRVTATGKLKLISDTANDGTKIAVGILCHAVNATAGDVEAPIYVGGTFHPDLLEWPAGIATEAARVAVFDKSPIHLRSPT